MKDIYGVIGGDLRNVELVKLLSSKGYDVKTYDLFENEKESLEEIIDKSMYIISATPFSRDNEIINSKGNREKVGIDRLFNRMRREQILFAGSISNKVRDKAVKYDVNICDLLDDESFAILNAIPSAEGAIEIALKSMGSTLHSANCLVLGYGRIGKVLTNILKGFNSRIYVAARKESDLAWIKSLGYIPVKYYELDEIINDMDVIFNTVPHVIINEKELVKVDKKCVIIDLASSPGGINFEKAKSLGIETYWALGLPGKVAPKSVAKYMFENIISKVERN